MLATVDLPAPESPVNQMMQGFWCLKAAARRCWWHAAARDFPCPTERPEIAELHFRAINSFSELTTALYNEAASKREHLWKSAMDSAATWLNAVTPS